MNRPEARGDRHFDAFYRPLSPDQLAALRRADEMLETVAGAEAETTFRRGDASLIARDAIAKGTFTEWCALRWPHHRTFAYALMGVARNLVSHRARLVAAGVDRAVLHQREWIADDGACSE